MKFLKADGDSLVFQLGRREKALLLELLKLYPLVPPGHYRIGSDPTPAATDPNQQLLEEALAEHRKENRSQLEAMLQESGRFESVPGGYRLVLSASQLEWLLQVLNDIRVGSWLHLGSPDEKKGKRVRLSVSNARYLWALEMAGAFESILLGARQ